MSTQDHAGKLVIVGGGEDRGGEMRVLREFVRLSGGPEAARIVVMTAASTEPERQDERYRDAFGRLDVRDFRLLVTDTRSEADRAQAVGIVERATGVFFTGGDQKRIVSLLHDTKLDRELHRRVPPGPGIARPSARAARMVGGMLHDGETGECPP